MKPLQHQHDSHRRNARFGVIAIILSTLTGCAAGFDDEFSCNKVGGISGCTDMTEVRQLADSGAFSGHEPHTVSHLPTATLSTSATTYPHATPMDFIPLPRRNRDGFPVRTSEKVQKVTIFPFINDNGDFVDTTDVYIVLDKSQWTGRPAHLIKKD